MSKLKRLKRANKDPKKAAEKRLPYLREKVAPAGGQHGITLMRSFQETTRVVSEYQHSRNKYGVRDEFIEARLKDLYDSSRKEEYGKDVALDTAEDMSSIEAMLRAYTLFLDEGSITIELTEDVALSLLLTSAPELEDIPEGDQFPWNCFKIVFPKGVIPAAANTSVSEALVFIHSERKKMHVFDNQFYLEDADPGFFIADDAIPHTDDSTEAIHTIARNLVAMISLEPESILNDEPATSRRKYSRDLSVAHMPVEQVYVANPDGIWGDAKVNRQAYEQSMIGRDFKTMTWFRRGHWRLQRCGPGLSEQKRVRVAPSWCHRSPDLKGKDGNEEEDPSE